jgi:hypothetical protein
MRAVAVTHESTPGTCLAGRGIIRTGFKDATAGIGEIDGRAIKRKTDRVRNSHLAADARDAAVMVEAIQRADRLARSGLVHRAEPEPAIAIGLAVIEPRPWIVGFDGNQPIA